jgi:FAD dependent oxidoreductase TIGR03364
VALADQQVDLAVVGAGIVGLAHAVRAAERGLSVAVVERDAAPLGASIRNFGHVYLTAQSGEALDYAREGRRLWLELGREADFPAFEAGTLLLARWPEELRVIEEFAAGREGAAGVLTPEEVVALAPVDERGLLGALWTPDDVRIDPRRAAPAIASWLAEERGVAFHWRTAALEIGSHDLTTSRGVLEADAIVVAAGHDLDLLLPEVTDEADVRRCTLQMLRVAPPDDRTIVPALATGLALLRYSGFAECPSLPELRERYLRERPDLLALGVNLLMTQQPGGEIVLGDTHRYDLVAEPFRDEAADELLLAEAAELLGVDRLEPLARWLGVYAYAPDREFLVATPHSRVRAVAVTSGIGMTTALGLAGSVLAELFEQAPSHV